jgi:hypothetical protein
MSVRPILMIGGETFRKKSKPLSRIILQYFSHHFLKAFEGHVLSSGV